jgi:hypothetical protein
MQQQRQDIHKSDNKKNNVLVCPSIGLPIMTGALHLPISLSFPQCLIQFLTSHEDRILLSNLIIFTNEYFQKLLPFPLVRAASGLQYIIVIIVYST